jgi:hypothetical protein
MFHYHHSVTVGATSRIPFECDACRFQGTAIVTMSATGWAKSDRKHDAHATRAATTQAEGQLRMALPRIAEIAACPVCGHRSTSAIEATRRRGRKIAVGGALAVAIGVAVALAIGGGLGWILGAAPILFGLVLAPLGIFALPMSIAGANKAVRFEASPQSAHA